MDEQMERKIRDRAHELWLANGQPEGRDLEHWVEAERQIMEEQGQGEPVAAQPEPPAPGDRPEPQPEPPADPLRNPMEIASTKDPEYPATPGPQERPASRATHSDIPIEPGASDIAGPAPGPADLAPAPEAGAADTARVRSGGRKAEADGMTGPAATAKPAPKGTTATPGNADAARKSSSTGSVPIEAEAGGTKSAGRSKASAAARGKDKASDGPAASRPGKPRGGRGASA